MGKMLIWRNREKSREEGELNWMDLDEDIILSNIQITKENICIKML